eukprot:TRINITY_DN9213_c0_g1_i5.p1 TRINITY_DN9213_c0_g1~~TRINITY_DN9213_c0_g1_i5.p1  ORF type:complete len:158 (+),score=24.26 TRINITY_DN9213_c0_g1_i5:174-647(+)
MHAGHHGQEEDSPPSATFSTPLKITPLSAAEMEDEAGFQISHNKEVVKFCHLHNIPDEVSRLMNTFKKYSDQNSDTIKLSGFLEMAQHCGILSDKLREKQVSIIFHSAAHSKQPDAGLSIEQFLRTFAMLAARVIQEAPSYMAGTKELLIQYILPLS